MNERVKMRLGILTIHAAINYGSVLQAYALQHYIKRIKKEDIIEIIDYKPAYIMDKYSVSILKSMNSVSAFVKMVLSYSHRVDRNRVFESFINEYISLSSKEYLSFDELKKDYRNWDAFIIGSDQVWNPEIVGNDMAFCLRGCPSNLKGTFSSSFGTEKIPEAYLSQLKQELKSFKTISVRENSAKEMLENGSKKISVVCDPVFLLENSEWIKIEKKPQKLPEKYIAFYSVEKNKKLEKIALDFSKRYNMDIVDLGNRNRKSDYLGIHSSAYGPQEFLYIIRNAEAVFTNSFHGTAFSTIFKKKCFVMLHESRGIRILELLSLSNGEKNVLPGNCDFELVENLYNLNGLYDYRLLNERIMNSKKYISDMLDAFEMHTLE